MAGSNIVVFVVDDDPSVLKALSRLLRSAGHRVETFTSVRDFLDHACYDLPCLLVLDIRMPDQSGLDL
jgi:FixJ family two-component response regulator